MPQIDVGIVGGGPVGLLLACLLAQVGVDVAVFDRRTRSESLHSARAIGIHPPGLAALHEAGVGADIRRAALLINGGAAHFQGSVLTELELGNRGIFTLQQHVTEQILRARLAELSPDALRIGANVETFRDVSASLVVAADGVHSGIRRELGIGWRRAKGEGRYAMCDVPDSEAPVDPGSGWVRLYCEPEGIVESFPLPGGHRRWVVSEPGELSNITPAEFTRIIKRRTGSVVPLGDADVVSTFIASQHVAESLSRGRVVLVGDAAHEVSPIGGQGMNLGWIGAVRLRSAILGALRTGEPDFREYERATLRMAAVAQRRALFNMCMGQPASGTALLLRNTMIKGVGATALNQVLARKFSMHGIG